MTTLLALILWAWSFVTFGYVPDHIRPMFPADCTIYEDGSGFCPGLRLPGYDDLER